MVDWLANLQVDTILIQEMGRNPYKKIQSYGNISLYHVGFERIVLSDVMEKFQHNSLIKIDNENNHINNQINKIDHYLIKLALMRITLTTRDIVNAAINAIEISVIDFVSLV